jgi:hypothetical protein
MKKLLLTLYLFLGTQESYATGTVVAHLIQASTDGNGFTTSPIDTSMATWMSVQIVTQFGACASDVSDNKGNSYATTWAIQQPPFLAIFKFDTPNVGAGHTFTFGAGCSSSAPIIAVQAWSGTTGSPPSDQIAITVVTGSGSIQGGSITPTSPDNVAMSALTYYSGTLSIDSGFMILDSLATVPGQSYGLAFAYKIQSSATSVNPVWTVTSDNYVASNFDIKSTAASVTGPKINSLTQMGVGK